MTKSARLYFKKYEAPNSEEMIGIKKTLYHGISKYQEIEVLESYDFGNLLVLNGVIQSSSRHQFIYSEMITHPVMFALGKNVKNALVFGGGNGGTQLELLKHKNVKIDVCELDEEVVNVCKKYLPEVASSFRDKRVKLIIDDGYNFIKKTKHKYNLIISDVTHLTSTTEKLFTKRFYKLCGKKLDESLSGLVTHGSGSPFQDVAALNYIFKNLKGIFNYVNVYLASIPTYHTGLFSFIYASNNTPLTNFDETYYGRLAGRNNFMYYNKDIHFGSQKLPEFVKEILKEKK